MKKNISEFAIFYLFIIGVILFIIYQQYKSKQVAKNGYCYAISEVVGFDTLAKGGIYVKYRFKVGNSFHESEMDLRYKWEKDYHYWKIGDTFFVKYEVSDPSYGEVLYKLPKGIKLGDTISGR